MSDDPEVLEEINGYIRTQFDCDNCGEVFDVEGDASGEVVTCDSCQTKFKVRLVR